MINLISEIAHNTADLYNNCFDNYWDAIKLVNDAILTINKHK